MKSLLRAFTILHGLMAALFSCAALMLIIIAAKVGWLAVASGLDRSAAQQIIEAVGLLAAAVVALQIEVSHRPQVSCGVTTRSRSIQ